jgi:hypothetical protein
MTHTPGPWVFGHVLKRPDLITAISEATEAEGKEWTIMRPLAAIHLRPGEKLSDPEIQANARLIAAAPELLEVCKAVIYTYENQDAASDTLDKAYAAVAKAEGRS